MNCGTRFQLWSTFALSSSRPLLWTFVLCISGDLIGDFNLGSTIVLIFEAPRKFRFRAREAQKVRYGQGIGLCPKRGVNK